MPSYEVLGRPTSGIGEWRIGEWRIIEAETSLRPTAQSALCLNASADAAMATAGALQALALTVSPVPFLTLVGDITCAWHVYRSSRRLRSVAAKLSELAGAPTDSLLSCGGVGTLDAVLHDCLSSIDQMLTNALSAPFAGWFLRTACREMARRAGEVSEILQDLEIARSVDFAHARQEAASPEALVSWENVKAGLKL